MDRFYPDTRDDACGIFLRVKWDVTGKLRNWPQHNEALTTNCNAPSSMFTQHFACRTQDPEEKLQAVTYTTAQARVLA